VGLVVRERRDEEEADAELVARGGIDDREAWWRVRLYDFQISFGAGHQKRLETVESRPCEHHALLEENIWRPCEQAFQSNQAASSVESKSK
jgi:hypothetical protein